MSIGQVHSGRIGVSESKRFSTIRPAIPLPSGTSHSFFAYFVIELIVRVLLLWADRVQKKLMTIHH